MIEIVPPPKIDGCLLTYSFDSYPSPLQVSPAGDKKYQHGIIKVVVSTHQDQKVFCKEIRLTLPVGVDAEHLTNTPETISVQVYTNVAKQEWKVDNEGGVITATPKGGGSGVIDSGDSLVLVIYYIQVNKKAGIFEIGIEEITSPISGDCTKKEYKQYLSKFPHGFFLKDFAAYKEFKDDDPELIPITEVDNSGVGEKVTLAWRGSVTADYRIFYTGQEEAEGAVPTGRGRWTSNSVIREATTFRLEASAGECVKGYMKINVGVRKPDLEVKSLKVGNTSLDGLFRGCMMWWFNADRGEEGVETDIVPPEGFAFCAGVDGPGFGLEAFRVLAGGNVSMLLDDTEVSWGRGVVEVLWFRMKDWYGEIEVWYRDGTEGRTKQKVLRQMQVQGGIIASYIKKKIGVGGRSATRVS